MNFFIGAFYDGVYLLGMALNETLTEGEDIRNGLAITKRMWGRDFHGKLHHRLGMFSSSSWIGKTLTITSYSHCLVFVGCNVIIMSHHDFFYLPTCFTLSPPGQSCKFPLLLPSIYSTSLYFNRIISGITGHVRIDDDGDRDADYSILDLDPITGKFEVVAHYLGLQE